MSLSPALLFISDLHLSPDRPKLVGLFHRFMQEVAPGASSLYILGDFFETWVGDEELTQPFNASIASWLKDLSEQGIQNFFLPGNRDFLAGIDFIRTAGLTLLPDPTRINLFGIPTLLTHGDIFCTDDAAYQAFRREVRDPAWQAVFLAKTLAERHAMARALRERSEQAKANKKPEIMDVSNETVTRMIREQGVQRIIHGHTHRPAHHEFEVDGVTRERWVLPDWYETGGYLRCDVDGCRAVAFP
jgi:UDP-2,3-diacylglucosamine hydrolase